jgi:hypothetical protein
MQDTRIIVAGESGAKQRTMRPRREKILAWQRANNLGSAALEARFLPPGAGRTRWQA